MTTPDRPERDSLSAEQTADTVADTADWAAPSDPAGKPLYAEASADQGMGVAGRDLPAEGELRREDTLSAPVCTGAVKTVTYSAETGGVEIEESSTESLKDTHAEGGLLDTLKEKVMSGTEKVRQRGGQLAHSAKLRLEVSQYSRDLESLYTRLGRAYHHRSAPEVLALIEQEIAQVERDIQVRERQLESQEVGQELRVQHLQAERERLDLNFPDTTVPSAADSFTVGEQPPRIVHALETEKRDTFFGLDKGGVEHQATVVGGNAAFDTQIEPEESVLTVDDLEADGRRS